MLCPIVKKHCSISQFHPQKEPEKSHNAALHQKTKSVFSLQSNEKRL